MASLLPFGVLLLSPLLLVGAVASVLVGTFVATARRAETQPRVEDNRFGVGRVLVLVAAALGATSVLVAAGQVVAV